MQHITLLNWHTEPSVMVQEKGKIFDGSRLRNKEKQKKKEGKQ